MTNALEPFQTRVEHLSTSGSVFPCCPEDGRTKAFLKQALFYRTRMLLYRLFSWAPAMTTMVLPTYGNASSARSNPLQSEINSVHCVGEEAVLAGVGGVTGHLVKSKEMFMGR